MKPETDGYLFVEFSSESGLYLMNLAERTFSLIDSDQVYVGRARYSLEVLGDRIVYIVGSDSDGYEIRTADPINGEDMRTVISSYDVWYFYDYDNLYDVTSDNAAILYSDPETESVLRTEIATGDTTTAAVDVYMFRYVRASDQLVVVRGGEGDGALPGDGLYIVP